MLISTAAASVLEFDQSLSLSLSLSLSSLSGFAWHAFLVLSNLRYLKIPLALQRTTDITMHNGTSKRNTHTHIHTCKQKDNTQIII